MKPAKYNSGNHRILCGVGKGLQQNKAYVKKIQRKERKWNDRFAVPISTYNEAVFRKYKVSFEQI